MRNFIAISLAVACCFQVAQGQCADFEQSFYELFEDIGEEDLALRVCVEARENTVIRLLTEERSATENEDYEPVDEVLQLTANNRECIGAIIEEDLKSEGNEEFDMVLLDNTGSECNRVTITLLDEEDNTFVYSGDTPSVVDNMVFLNFTLGSAVVDMQCIVFNQDVIEANCSDGNTNFSLSRNPTGSLRLVVTTIGLNSESFTDVREFRLGVNGRCSVVLINEGLVIESRSVTVNFGLTAPSSVIDMDPPAVTFQCTLITIIDDTRRREDCTSPYKIDDLNPGDYILRINLRADQDVCDRTLRNSFEFNIA